MSPAQSAAGFRHFHDQLAELKQRLLEMSERGESLVELAVDALLTRDAGKAEAVISGDQDLDIMEVQVEQIAINLLALQQPMARDLRFIIGALKISSDLERVGDHAVNIAQAALRIVKEPSDTPAFGELAEMARRARRMLGDALDAFVRADGALGRQVCAQDDEVDALHDSSYKTLIGRMKSDPRLIQSSVQLLLVSRNLERVADLATNIGEDAVYLAEGKQIKHHAEQRGMQGK